MTRVVVHRAALAALSDGPEMRAALDSLGGQVADRARQLAPKRSGAGAESIHHEVGSDQGSAYARVSWDPDHFYMLYQELGTSRMSAQPFLRPALDGGFSL